MGGGNHLSLTLPTSPGNIMINSKTRWRNILQHMIFLAIQQRWVLQSTVYKGSVHQARSAIHFILSPSSFLFMLLFWCSFSHSLYTSHFYYILFLSFIINILLILTCIPMSKPSAIKCIYIKDLVRLWLLQNQMLKIPLYGIVASNFTCSQISLIWIQSMQHKK